LCGWFADIIIGLAIESDNLSFLWRLVHYVDEQILGILRDRKLVFLGRRME
jgi:hypothetical protein